MSVKPTIQTLHPVKGKVNKCISLDKYEAIRSTLLGILQDSTPTHTELMELMYEQLSETFSGNVQWYGETVKLDLEARNIIKRSNNKPITYSLV
jgi:hypothetical protein